MQPVAACNYKHVNLRLQDPAAPTCADDCTASYPPNPSWYRACLATCPGAQSADGKCDAADQPPVAMCEENGELKGVVALAIIFGGLSFLVVGSVIAAAGGIRDTINN